MPRYIDADALQSKAYQMNFDQRISERELFVVNYLIKVMHKVDAEPVRHGRWIYKGVRGRFPVCECSVCGNAENADWAVLGDNVNYCPNCGAKMDEVEE